MGQFAYDRRRLLTALESQMSFSNCPDCLPPIRSDLISNLRIQSRIQSSVDAPYDTSLSCWHWDAIHERLRRRDKVQRTRLCEINKSSMFTARNLWKLTTNGGAHENVIYEALFDFIFLPIYSLRMGKTSRSDFLGMTSTLRPFPQTFSV